ncbi:MAG: sulfite exporter TauE/SafE family protein [Gemmatimonadota bacterium]
MPHAWTSYLILFAAGCLAGTINVIAGGGSFLTLPLMIFLGLPPTTANGTNRIAILVQNAGAVWSFHRHRILEWRWLAVAAPPAVLGAVLGAWSAVRIGDAAFERILATLMVGISLWALWNPLSGRHAGDTLRPSSPLARLGLMGGFLTVGFYGGFVQAGVGFLFLGLTAAAGLNLVRGNALKVLIILAYTPLTLALFSASGKVEWGLGLALAAGNLLGGLAGVRLTVLKGHRWVKRVVTVTVILFALKLWLAP